MKKLTILFFKVIRCACLQSENTKKRIYAILATHDGKFKRVGDLTCALDTSDGQGYVTGFVLAKSYELRAPSNDCSDEETEVRNAALRLARYPLYKCFVEQPIVECAYLEEPMQVDVLNCDVDSVLDSLEGTSLIRVGAQTDAHSISAVELLEVWTDDGALLPVCLSRCAASFAVSVVKGTRTLFNSIVASASNRWSRTFLRPVTREPSSYMI